MERGAARALARCEQGVTVSELMMCIFIVSLVLATTLPFVTTVHRTAAMAALSRKLSCQLMSCRARAVFQHQSVALVFEKNGEHGWRCYVVEDGDGDGVRRDDINRGRDRKVSEVIRLHNSGAGLGILQEVAVPDPSGRGNLTTVDDPIRAGRGDIITFTFEGTATPSSIYLTDHRTRMRVIRVYGATGKIHMLEWRPGWERWERPPW